MWNAWHGAGLHRGTPNEVACVKNLIEMALPQVDKVWHDILKKVGVEARLQGVVCHGHPWVKYSGARKRCELGDFLLVRDHQPDNGLLSRRAVIVQAKVFHRTGVRVKNPTQLNLYQRWPRFTYESWPGGLANLDRVHACAGLMLPVRRDRELSITGAGKRPASPAMLDSGCRYGMIDVEYSRWGDPLHGMNPWRLCSVQTGDIYTFMGGHTLAGYLVRLMAGEFGRRAPITKWPARLSVACHWSLMVMELLSILPSAPVSSSSNIAFLAATPNLNLKTTGRLPPTPIDQGEADEDEGTFGVIYIQTFGDLPGEDE